MLKGIFWKIFLASLIPTFILIFLLTGINLLNQIRNIEKTMVSNIKNQVDLVSIMIEKGITTRAWPFETLSKFSEAEEILFWWVINSDQKVYMASDITLLGMQLRKEEVISLIENQEITDFLKDGQKIKLIKKALNIGPKDNPWNLFVGISMKPIQMVVRQTVVSLVIFSLLIFFLIVGLSYFISKRITAPIKELTKEVETIAKGNFEYRTKIKTGDELEELGKSINQMAKDLGESYRALEESKKVLEIKVKARTKELRELAEGLEAEVERRTKEVRERMEELEKFHRLAVGRELKMIELKKEIDKLKKELEKRSKK